MRLPCPIWTIDDKGKFEKGKQPKSKDKSLRQVGILLDNGSTASQAVGPPLSDVEMSWLGRSFPDVGRKMLQLTPLALQNVDRDDSVLGRYANQDGQGLKPNLKYSTLVKKAFRKRFWKSDEITPDGYTLMEQNFSLFWGLSIMLYESTLVSDDTPFDRWIKGDESALSDSAKEGFEIFTNQGKRISCHSGPEFSGAAISQLRGVLAAPDEPLIKFIADADWS